MTKPNEETVYAIIAITIGIVVLGAWMTFYVNPREKFMMTAYQCASERVSDTASYEEHRYAYMECAEELAEEMREGYWQ